MRNRPPTPRNCNKRFLSMHFPAVQGLLNNISKVYHWGIKENLSNYDDKEITFNTGCCFSNLVYRVTKLVITLVLLTVHQCIIPLSKKSFELPFQLYKNHASVQRI